MIFCKEQTQNDLKIYPSDENLSKMGLKMRQVLDIKKIK